MTALHTAALIATFRCRAPARCGAFAAERRIVVSEEGRLPGLVGVMDHGLPMAWRTRLATFCRIPESRIRVIYLQSQFPNRNLSWFTHARAFQGSPGEPSI
jgi:hypothetical protein